MHPRIGLCLLASSPSFSLSPTDASGLVTAGSTFDFTLVLTRTCMKKERERAGVGMGDKMSGLLLPETATQKENTFLTDRYYILQKYVISWLSYWIMSEFQFSLSNHFDKLKSDWSQDDGRVIFVPPNLRYTCKFTQVLFKDVAWRSIVGIAELSDNTFGSILRVGLRVPISRSIKGQTLQVQHCH